MKIMSWNVNGIRACVKKNFFESIEQLAPDLLCLQEIKAMEHDLEDHICNPNGYFAIWHPAQKKGYSGVAILTKIKPSNVVIGMGNEKFDSEGRVLQADFDDLSIFSVYFPNGQRDEERLQYKLDFYDAFFTHCDTLLASGKKLVICGDYNTAHYPIDLARPKENEKTSGFLPIEREWLDNIVARGYVDTFREFNKSPEQYTWWSYRANARRNNVGWRIDYVFVDQSLISAVKNAEIFPDIHGSDHCPVSITID